MIDRLHQLFLTDQEEALGRLAVKRGLISEAQLEEALKDVRERSRRLAIVLSERGWLKTDDLLSLIEVQVQEEMTRLVLSRNTVMPPEVQNQLSNPSMNIDEFTLVSKLGRGGAGEVWKAWDRQLGRWVAIKRPLVVPDSASTLERFRREVLATARLAHPNIVPIYRVSEHDGRPYIVMQLVEGRPLEEVRMPLRRALEVVRTVAHAVHHAHVHGVVHRDLKPENIMVDDAGGVWVLDFGLANLLEGKAITVTGTVMGTPSYMSPEQARGESAAKEPGTDIYSLGATLYTLVTGRPPFDGPSVATIIHNVVESEPVYPRKIDPQIPSDVETIILKALEKARERRYPTSMEMAEDLQRFLDGEPIHAKRVSYTYRLKKKLAKHRWLAATATIAVLAVAALTGKALIQKAENDRLLAAAKSDLDLAERCSDPVEKLRLYERAAALLPEARDKAADLQRRVKEAKPHYDQGLDQFRKLDRLLTLPETQKEDVRASADETLKCFQRALEVYPQYGEAALQIARVHYEVQKSDEAMTWCTRAVELTPELATAYLLRALLRTERYEQMRHNSRGGRTRDETEQSIQLEKEIIDDLAQAEKWNKDAAEVEMARGVLQFAKGEYAAAAAKLEAYLQRVPSDWRALTMVAHAYVHVPNYGKTVEWAGRAIQVRPRHAINFNERGLARSSLGDVEGAISDFTKSIELEPERLSAHMNRASCRMSRKEYDLAIQDFERVIQLDPKYRSARFGMADAYARSGRPEQAIEIYSAILERDPDNAAAFHQRGNLKRRTKDLLGAIEDLESAARLRPEDPNKHGDLGLVYEAFARTGRPEFYKSAQISFDTALRIAEPDWVNREMIERHLSDVRKKTGN